MSSAALKLQRLQARDQVLVLARVAESRSDSGRFATRDVERLFDAVRIPASSLSAVLSNLRDEELVIASRGPGGNAWAVTPEGRERADVSLAEIDQSALLAEEVAESGAEFLHALHTVLDPLFAPARWAPGIRRLHEQFPFDQSVFCMTRFPDEDGALPDPVAAVVESLRGVAASHGLVLHLASDRQLDDDVFGNIGAYMWGCRYGIGLVEDRVERGLNYNVVTELGAMLMTGRRCALLKDRTAPTLPTDLAAQIYKPTDFDDLRDVDSLVHSWIADDLGLPA